MAELVPKHGFPVRRVARPATAGLLAVTTRPKQTPEQAVGAGEAERPHGELLALREDLHDHGARDRHAVLLAERLLRTPQQVQDPPAVEFGLARLHPHEESIALAAS